MAGQISPVAHPLIVTAAALVDAQARVLVQRRPGGASHAGLWEFPGGKVEPGEEFAQALIRELAEELGIAVDRGDLSPACFTLAPGLLLLLFLCRRWQGVPKPLHATELRWVFTAELYALEMPPADAPLLPLLEMLVGSGAQPDR